MFFCTKNADNELSSFCDYNKILYLYSNGANMTIATRLMTLIMGKKVGEDQFGNKYYLLTRKDRRDKRWVIYKGEADASKVPAEWWGWLHHKNDNLPPEHIQKKAWQQEHQPNLTGSREAYRPQGHTLKGGKRAKATGDYQAWQPK